MCRTCWRRCSCCSRRRGPRPASAAARPATCSSSSASCRPRRCPPCCASTAASAPWPPARAPATTTPTCSSPPSPTSSTSRARSVESRSVPLETSREGGGAVLWRRTRSCVRDSVWCLHRSSGITLANQCAGRRVFFLLIGAAEVFPPPKKKKSFLIKPRRCAMIRSPVGTETSLLNKGLGFLESPFSFFYINMPFLYYVENLSYCK